MSSEAAEIARAAAREIERRGWNQGSYMGDVGTVYNCTLCASGALNLAAAGVPDDENWADSPLGAEIFQRVEERTGEILADWNDAPGRTGADVIALLNAVADDLDAQ